MAIGESGSAEYLFWRAETFCRGMGKRSRQVLLDASRLRTTMRALVRGVAVAGGVVRLRARKASRR